MENKTENTRVIEVGKFYLIFDGSRTGHPGLVVWKDDEANIYLVIRTDSDKPGETTKEERGVKHIIKLKHPTSTDVVNYYVKNVQQCANVRILARKNWLESEYMKMI